MPVRDVRLLSASEVSFSKQSNCNKNVLVMYMVLQCKIHPYIIRIKSTKASL